MSIPIKREPEELKELGYEKCVFCGKQTVYWHEKTNNPVCPGCAKKHKVSEIPKVGFGWNETIRKIYW